MKNLKLSTELPARIHLRSEGETLLFSAFDAEQNRAFFASSSNVLYALSLAPLQKENHWSRDIFSYECGSTLEPDDNITALDYLMEKEAVVVGTSNGHLLLYVVDLDVTEIVGRVEGGINAIATSPDGALLAVITGLGQLLVMSHDWEILYEVSLDPQLLDDEIVNAHLNGFDNNQLKSIISWRGDGKYFATLNGLSGKSSASKLKIWERDSGSLHATAESNNLVGECLAWMPSGAKLAAAYDKKAVKRCPSIVLFEKNGLERSSFSIEEPIETVIKNLKWNCTSDLLAGTVSCDGHEAIKIWYFSNNHWYLKQEIRYPKTDVVNFDWDLTQPLCLMCWTVNGKITIYNFIWATAVMETSDAFVIDNSMILVSPLDISLIPPPMFLFTLKFCSPVQEFAFTHKNTKSKLAVLLADQSLCIVELPPKDAWERFEGETFFVQASHCDAKLQSMRHITWLDSHVLIGAFSSDSVQPTAVLSLPPGLQLNGCQSIETALVHCLAEIELVCSENSVPGSIASSGWRVENQKEYFVEGSVVGIVSNPMKKFSAFIQLDGGSILEYKSRVNINEGYGDLQLHQFRFGNAFSASCPWMKAVVVQDGDMLDSLVFGLDYSGNLQVGQRTLCSNCSSFSFYADNCGLAHNMMTHLIFTTKQDLLFIATIDDILYGNSETQNQMYTTSRTQTKKGDNNDILNIWERGAKLAGVIHGDEASVILQAPRGNLECIYPRKLVLAAIANALIQQRFRDAMLMVRRHRIDFNIIVDYCGLQSFIKSASEFVRQVSNLGHITEFVCAIKNETLVYKSYKKSTLLACSKVSEAMPSVGADGFQPGHKVRDVLQAVRKAIEELVTESPARELCILTTLARSDPPEMEEALRRIKVVRELELQGTDAEMESSYPSAEEAMKHLLWLLNAEAVYDAALGLYDLNLAAIVALNSDKDPKEFLPFLRELECMQPFLMRYKIDLRLQRYESALKNIASAGDDYFGDCLSLMKSNPQLFPLGIQLFSDKVKHNQILDAWGDHLHEEKYFEEAATTYVCSSSFQKALKAYRACGDWKGVLSVAGILKLTKEEVLQLASELCDELQALGKPAEAAKIALEYCADAASGIAYYAMAREWQECLRVAYLYEREDLVNEVESFATECANTLMSEYEEGLEKVGKYVVRYLAVRQRRLSLAAKIQSEEGAINDIDDDNISETSSTLSGMSIYMPGSIKGSNASVSSSTVSKGKRVGRQRNRGKIRAGSPGEELALIEHLKGMSLTVGAQQELKRLLLTLLMLGKEETARKLQRIASNFELTQVAAVKVVEDAATRENLDESAHSLDYYIKDLRNNHGSAILTWQIKALL